MNVVVDVFKRKIASRSYEELEPMSRSQKKVDISSTNYLPEGWSHPTVMVYLTHSENIQNIPIISQGCGIRYHIA